jgi:hypothetical protein
MPTASDAHRKKEGSEEVSIFLSAKGYQTTVVKLPVNVVSARVVYLSRAKTRACPRAKR